MVILTSNNQETCNDRHIALQLRRPARQTHSYTFVRGACAWAAALAHDRALALVMKILVPARR
jgi:hypothetical protein